MSENRERLRRLLLIVPYVARHPGVRVGELARKLGVEQKDLLEDFELLTLVGRPPFSPDDFIDIYVQDDRCFVALDQRFSRPPRLTPAEAAALWASAQLMQPAARSALGNAQKKLEQALPPQARKLFGGLARRVGAESAPMDDLLEPLARAARESREVEFDYLAAGRDKGERRAVQPWSVFLSAGNWYLAGFCLARQGERLFRVDRISQLTITDRRFTPTQPVRVEVGSSSGPGARVRFTRRAAPWIHERFGSDVAELPDGSVEVELAGASAEWVVPFVLSFGGEAEVIAPTELRSAVLDAAQRAISRLTSGQ